MAADLTPRGSGDGSALRHAFRALRTPAFRVFWVGQWVSVTGTWMQTLALSWLVYRMTDSPLQLGVLSAARFGPSLIASPFAGVLADRIPRRTVVLITQTLSLLQSSVLAALTLTGAVQLWHVLALALLQGFVDTADMPARQTLQLDLVGPGDLQSAVSLNSMAFNAGRIAGPALAGALVAAVGEGWCFAANAASYLAVLVALLAIRAPVGARASVGSVRQHLVEGVLHAWRTPAVRTVLAAVTVTSVFGLSYTTILPVFARDVLKAGPEGYGLLLAGAGVGAIAGAFVPALRRRSSGTGAVIAAGQAGLGVGLLALASTRAVAPAVAWMVVLGVAVAVQLSTSNGFLQTSAPPGLAGRLMSLYIWLFVGLAPVGGFLAGWAAERFGAPRTAAGAGVICLTAALASIAGWARRRHRVTGE